MKRPKGFSLLEAIVSLTVLAAAGMALFAAMSQSLQMVARAERSREADTAMRNALSLVEQINPMLTPTGEREIGMFELRWRAESIEPPRDNASGTVQRGLFSVGLYRLHIELWRGGNLERDAVVRRIGYRQVRTPATP